VAVAELLHYLRGRDRMEIVERLRAGVVDGGIEEIDVFPDELAALRALVAGARPGDVVGVTALGMRPEVFAWLEDAGAERPTPGRVKRLVALARER
jgi:hypothetical protein